MSIEALKELAAKVEAGQFISRFNGPEHRVWPGMEDMNSMKRHHLRYSYHGSLDAAKALHDAVLPGWHGVVETDGEVNLADVPRSPSGTYSAGEIITVQEKDPARAWLLAILKALIAQGEPVRALSEGDE